MADLTGHTLGNYRIEGPLGAGGMGEVYRALHVRLDRPAAIKVLRANQATDPTFQARFLREARAAAALSHPNIVEVFDFGEQDGDSYLVMELVPDGSLRTLLRQRSAQQGWTLGLGVDLVRQAAEGLAYAHAHGMVHRDIKPDNLLLQRLPSLQKTAPGQAAERYQLKISDFGLARLVDDSGELTVTGMVMGTPTYMSPEQCQGGDLDGRSDLYSLGVVLYEVATGTPPFRVKTLSEAVFKHISAAPVPPRELSPDLPLALDEVILRCLEKRPDDRFATGTELSQALDGALGETELRTVVTRRPTSAPFTPTPVKSVPSNISNISPDAPTIENSAPGHDTPAPPTPAPVVATTTQTSHSTQQSADTIGTAVSRDMSNEATISASAVTSKPPRARGSGSEWPGPDGKDKGGDQSGHGWRDDLQGRAQDMAARAVMLARKQPRAVGIGAVALALVIVLIVVLVTGSARSSGNIVRHGTPTVPALSPTASPTPVETVRFSDSLSVPSARWPSSTRSYYSNGGFEINGAWIVFAPSNTVGDGAVSVRLRQLSGPSNEFYGLLIRGTSNSHYYLFGISQNQQWTFSLVTNGNGRAIVAATTDTHLKQGLNATNTLKVRITGHHFVFFINGAQVGQADDSSIASGRVGIINTVGRLAVVYNNFTIATLK
jgi:serine/threonine protein kinase